jgi:proline iminopeptidase
MTTVATSGAELFTTTHGRGPACLWLTAIGAGPYELQAPRTLLDHLQLTFVELRGSGRSTGAATDVTFDRVAEDLEAVRRSLGAEKVFVLAHSIVGMLAIEYARRCPGSVAGAITAGTPPHGDMAKLVEQAKAFFSEDASEERRKAQQEAFARLPPNASPGAAMLAQTPSRFYDPNTDVAPLYASASPRPEVTQRLLGTLGPTWQVTTGEPLRVPLLLTHGRADYIVPHTLWAPVLPKLPTATFRLLEKSGHQPFYEEPEAFNTAVVKWMTGLR